MGQFSSVDYNGRFYMEFAYNDAGKRIEPVPEGRARCSVCSEELIAKCGPQRIWHWSHGAGTDCDPWSEPETAWHRGWKSCFHPDCREVVIAPHRADVRTQAGWVLEFQHSPISAEEIAERECFYGRMVWIIDASEFVSNLSLSFRGNRTLLEWKYARRCWDRACKHVYLDLRDRALLHIRKMPKYGDDLVEVGVIQTSEFVTRAGGIPRLPSPEPIKQCCVTCQRNLVMTAWEFDQRTKLYHRKCRKCGNAESSSKYQVPEHMLWCARKIDERWRVRRDAKSKAQGEQTAGSPKSALASSDGPGL